MSTMTRYKSVPSRVEAVRQFGGEPSSDLAGVTKAVYSVRKLSYQVNWSLPYTRTVPLARNMMSASQYSLARGDI
jgi:hypothetical protein